MVPVGLLLVPLLGAAPGERAAAHHPKPPIHPPASVSESDSLELSIAAPASVRRGEPVRFTLTAANRLDLLARVHACRLARTVKAAVSRQPTTSALLTARIDRVATHPLWGLGVLAGILGLLFLLTYTIGAPIQAWLDVNIVHGLARAASLLLAIAPA